MSFHVIFMFALDEETFLVTTSNKCHASSNKCLTSSNKKLLELDLKHSQNISLF